MKKVYLKAAKRIASRMNVLACGAIEDSVLPSPSYLTYLFYFRYYFSPRDASGNCFWWGFEEKDRLARTLALLLMQEMMDRGDL